MRRHSAVLILASVLPLAGCPNDRPPPPEVVYVEIEKIVPVPEELTKPCPAKRVKKRSVEALVDAYNTNTPIHEDCDKRMKRIRELPTDP